MFNQKKFIVSHAPFIHNGSSITDKTYNIMIAAFIAVLPSICLYGAAALKVVAISVSTAIIWEVLLNKATKRPYSVGNGNAALIGLLFAMLLPAGVPLWLVVIGTFIAVVIGKEIFGGMGANPFNPALIGYAILMVSWPDLLDFDEVLVNYKFDFVMLSPIAALKHFGPDSVASFSACDLLVGKQIGGIGSTCGILIILGGVYLIIRGFIRWEISVSFLAGVVITAVLFNLSDQARYGGPVIHLLSGYTLIGAFFLATDDSSSPVNFIPMLIYGAGCGIMTVLIRNIGSYVDGVVLAIILMNLASPLIDKIRPKAMGKV